MTTDPLQRPMFRIPGVNPAQVARSILAPPPTQPVAGQPLSLKNLITEARATLNDPNSNPVQVASLTTQLNERGIPVEGLTTNVAAKPLITGKKAVKKAFEGPFGEAAEPVETKVDDPEDVGPEAGDIGTLKNAVKAATGEIVEAGEVPPGHAERLLKRAESQVTALTETKDLSFKEALKAVGLDEKDYSSENYNDKAKELLGLDPSEADIPEWAAPIFLFGLNLMKAPVSTATRDTGLGGLLADIGKAGEVGFASFGKERDRKRKERAQVATLSSQLRTQDLSLRKQIFSEHLKLKEYNFNIKEGMADKTIDLAKVYATVEQNDLTATHREAVLNHNAKRTANSAKKLEIETLRHLGNQQDKAMAPYIEALKGNPGAMANFAVAFRTLSQNSLSEKQKALPPGEQVQILLKKSLTPGYFTSLAAAAANKAGITPAVDLTTIDFQGDEYSFDPIEMQRYVDGLNKKRSELPGKKEPPLTVTEVIRDALANPESPHRKMIIGSPKTVIKTISKEVEGVTTDSHFNETRRNKWFAANPPPKDPNLTAEYEKQVKLAEPLWLTPGDTYISGKPEFKERNYVDENGNKIKYYMNDLAFSQRRNSKKDLTIQDVLKAPKDYPKIIQGKITDYSGMGGKIDTFTFYDKGQKRVMSLDKRAYQKALEAGKLTAEDGMARIVELKIGRYIGSGVPVKPNERILTLDANGNMISIEAQNAKGVLGAFTSKKDQMDWRTRSTAVLGLNMVSWDIRDMFEKGNALGLATRITDWAGSAISLGRLVKTQLGYKNSTVISSLRAAADNEDTRGLLNSAISSFDKEGTMFAGVKLNKEQRAQMKSMFLNLAFGLASAREGGKLTDNDVKNALLTLGWDSTSWTQTPREVLGALRTAVRDANNKYITDYTLRMGAEEKGKLDVSYAKGGPGIIEQMLRTRAKASNNPKAGAMFRHFMDKSKGDQEYSLRFDYSDPLPNSDSVSGNRPFVTKDKSFLVPSLSADQLGTLSSAFSNARIPNRFKFIHKEMFVTPDTGTFITYDSPNEFNKSLQEKMTEIFKGKGDDFKYLGSYTADQYADKLLEYKKYLFDNGYFNQ